MTNYKGPINDWKVLYRCEMFKSPFWLTWTYHEMRRVTLYGYVRVLPLCIR